MCVYLFRGGTLIQAHKPVKQIFAGGVVIIPSRIIREVVTCVRGRKNINTRDKNVNIKRESERSTNMEKDGKQQEIKSQRVRQLDSDRLKWQK